jgi:acyl-CoA thioesterase FadM/ketosteroid isomerase-like protein
MSSVDEVVGRFMESQRAMYAGGPIEPVEALLAEDIVWHVPGSSPIAGDYRGRQAVLDYFRHRRARADGTMRIVEHHQVVQGDTMLRFADGEATLGGEQRRWRTVGVYRVQDDRLAEAWLVPLDSREFEAAWGASRSARFGYRQRVRPQDCATSEVMGHPRLLEVFEAAFIELWREYFGGLTESLDGRALTLADLQVSYRAPIRVDDVVEVDVFLDAVTSTSVAIHCVARVAGEAPAAVCTSSYVCLGADEARTQWPDHIRASLQCLATAAAR